MRYKTNRLLFFYIVIITSYRILLNSYKIFRIYFQEADIALASLTITRERSEAVRWTKPYMNTGISIMIKKPEKSKPGVLSFMEPLSYRVWGCIACGFFAVSFILYMVGRFSPYEWQDEGSTAAPSDVFSFVNTLWFSLGALMQQGPDIFPRCVPRIRLGVCNYKRHETKWSKFVKYIYFIYLIFKRYSNTFGCISGSGCIAFCYHFRVTPIT